MGLFVFNTCSFKPRNVVASSLVKLQVLQKNTLQSLLFCVCNVADLHCTGGKSANMYALIFFVILCYVDTSCIM